MDEGKRARLQALIARAGSSNEQEARTSAWIACKMMREEGITPEQAMAPKALAAAPGWTPPPERREDRYREPPRSSSGPDWDHGYRTPLLPSEDMMDQNRMLAQQAQMREAQALRARQQLAVASKRLRELEDERARQLGVSAARARLNREHRSQTVARPIPLPAGAGRSEKY